MVGGWAGGGEGGNAHRYVIRLAKIGDCRRFFSIYAKEKRWAGRGQTKLPSPYMQNGRVHLKVHFALPILEIHHVRPAACMRASVHDVCAQPPPHRDAISIHVVRTALSQLCISLLLYGEVIKTGVPAWCGIRVPTILPRTRVILIIRTFFFFFFFFSHTRRVPPLLPPQLVIVDWYSTPIAFAIVSRVCI